MSDVIEQVVRDMLTDLGIQNAQGYSAGDLVGAANRMIKALADTVQHTHELRCRIDGHASHGHQECRWCGEAI